MKNKKINETVVKDRNFSSKISAFPNKSRRNDRGNISVLDYDEKKIFGKIEKKESEKEIGYDCSCCDFACKLPNKDLHDDFVFCGNPDCKFHYHVLFEHFHCKSQEDEEEIDENKIIDYKDILNKNFPSAVCQHCNKVTNIQFSSDFKKLISRNRTLKEINKTLNRDWLRWMNIKNGQIEAMHKMIARLVELIPEEQKEKAKKITHEMRDEIKYAEKRLKWIKKEELQKVYKPACFNNNNIYPGDPKGSPDESFFSGETIIFIDANFLSKLSKHFGKGKYLIYDLIKFSDYLSRKQKLNCKEIYYYTAPPFQSDKPTEIEEKKKDGYDRFINKLKERKMIIREGRCQRLKIDDKFNYSQKAVDVLFVMDLTNVPIKYPNIKRIILVSSDSDFVPVIKNLNENGIKTILYTYYEKIRNTPFSVSNHLIKSVHKYALLAKEDFFNAPLKTDDKNEKKR